MQINNSFVVPLPLEQTWPLLLDVRKIIPCVPGTELLEVIEPQAFKARMRVRLGPVALCWVGTDRFEDVDEGQHRAQVRSKAMDAKGRGGANTTIAFGLSAVPEGTRVDVATRSIFLAP